MSGSPLSVPGGFRPGDRVQILLGEAVGLAGEVLSVLDAHVLWLECGRSDAAFQYIPGEVCVAVTILGVRVPLSLNIAHVRREPPVSN
jgi:transcription antitermination factor NusG